MYYTILRLFIVVGIFFLFLTEGMSAEEQNIDRPGLDFKSFELSEPNYLRCATECGKDNRCQAWTYVKPSVQGPKAKCWLKFAVPAVRHSDCCVSGIRDEIETNTDRLGRDYKNFDLQSPNVWACRDACRGDSRCRAWTYVNPGVQGPKARCWLKDAVPIAQVNTCCKSGVRSVLEPNTNRLGGDYKNFDLSVADPSACLTSCYQDTRCQAWTYVNAGVQGPQPRCWLKDSIPPTQPNNCCFSGIKIVP